VDDSTPLFCSGETPPGVLRPALEPSAQGRHGPAGVSPEEGHNNDQRDGTPLLWGKAERTGAVYLGEEKAPGRPYGSFPVPKGGATRKLERDSLQGHVVIGQGVMALNWKKVDLD